MCPSLLQPRNGDTALQASFEGPLQRQSAEPTGLEPATSSVTGRRSNQLSYGS